MRVTLLSSAQPCCPRT